MPCEPRGRVAVPALELDAAAAVLAVPWLTPAAAASADLARRAGSTGVPVVLAMRAGAGRLRVARALHALSGRPGPLHVATGRRPVVDGLSAGATLYVDAGRLAPETALALEAVLDDGGVWVLTGVDAVEALPPPFAHRLGAVTVDLPPLAARAGELPALADAVLARLAARAGRTAPSVTPAALEVLARHSWPGDLAELEAVLGAALVQADDRIDAAHVVVAPGLPPPSAAPAPPVHDAGLEFLVAEMAHEMRNPFVTVKTFARHLPALLEDAELRERFEILTNDAIERMDGLLENVLAFARMGAPRPQPVLVGPLVERVLADMQPVLAGRAVQVQQDGAARCAADPEQLAYALRNLFAGVVREVPVNEELALQATANGVVTLRFAGGTEAADRLRRLAAPGDAAALTDPNLLPLSFRLARAVIERNGGGLAVVPEGPLSTSVVIRLPAAPGEEAA